VKYYSTQHKLSKIHFQEKKNVTPKHKDQYAKVFIANIVNKVIIYYKYIITYYNKVIIY